VQDLRGFLKRSDRRERNKLKKNRRRKTVDEQIQRDLQLESQRQNQEDSLRLLAAAGCAKFPVDTQVEVYSLKQLKWVSAIVTEVQRPRNEFLYEVQVHAGKIFKNIAENRLRPDKSPLAQKVLKKILAEQAGDVAFPEPKVQQQPSPRQNKKTESAKQVKMCKNGCDFVGANEGYCSTCYDEMIEVAVLESRVAAPEPPISPKQNKKHESDHVSLAAQFANIRPSHPKVAPCEKNGCKCFGTVARGGYCSTCWKDLKMD